MPTRIGIFLALAFLAACAAPKTQKFDVSSTELEAEEQKQREVAITTRVEDVKRLHRIGAPLLIAALPFCDESAAWHYGFLTYSKYVHSDSNWQAAAASALNVENGITVVYVQPRSPAEEAGLRAGDEIVALNGVPIGEGQSALKIYLDAFAAASTAESSRMAIKFNRNGLPTESEIVGTKGCAYGLRLDSSPNKNELNAFADGENVTITPGMMRFADDDELAAVVGHEIAHNAMGHIEAKRDNMRLGVGAGLMLDLLAAVAGVNTGGVFTKNLGGIAARAYSQDFETEADYVGLYIVARAEGRLEAAPLFWRKMAAAEQRAISYGKTHPTTAERFVRLEKAADEIRSKQTLGLALAPELKEASGSDEPALVRGPTFGQGSGEAQ